jgi:hypothetical protein
MLFLAKFDKWLANMKMDRKTIKECDENRRNKKEWWVLMTCYIIKVNDDKTKNQTHLNESMKD